jgi:hypothetical protein
MRAIAKKADRLIAMHMPQSHDLCAAIAAEDQQEESCVVASGQAALSRKGKGARAGSFPAHFNVLLPCQVWGTSEVLRGGMCQAGN